MSAPDIRHLATMRERFMNDAVLITHNPQALTDQAMNANTGKPAVQTPTTVYAGKGDFVPLLGADLAEEGDNPIGLGYYALRIPVSAPPPEIGDGVEITACERDTEMVGKTFTVAEVPMTSYPSSRKIVVQSREAARARAGS